MTAARTEERAEGAQPCPLEAVRVPHGSIKALLQFIGWEVVNRTLLKLKARRRYSFKSSWAGINLGCGLECPPDWLGIDGGIQLLLRWVPQWFVKPLWRHFNLSGDVTIDAYFRAVRSVTALHHDLLAGIPVADGAVPAVYSSHFLEHLDGPDALFLLRECHRVLRPGGLIRVCVPSLDKEVQAIQEAISAYESGDVEKVQPFVTSPAVGFRNRFSGHKRMYNFSELDRALRKSGFTGVIQRDFRVGRMEDLEQLDTREGLYVEATKPIPASELGSEAGTARRSGDARGSEMASTL